MRKITINVPTDLIDAALEARTADNTNYQRVLRRWMWIGMEAEKQGFKPSEPNPPYGE